MASGSHQGGPGGCQGARNAIGCNAESRRRRAARRVAPKAQAAEFAANILPIIRMTGIGPVAVRCPACATVSMMGRSASAFRRRFCRPTRARSKSLEVLIPILYLKGVSTGDFDEALIALLGNDAGGQSASTVGRARKFTFRREPAQGQRLSLPEHASGRSRTCRFSY